MGQNDTANILTYRFIKMLFSKVKGSARVDEIELLWDDIKCVFLFFLCLFIFSRFVDRVPCLICGHHNASTTLALVAVKWALQLEWTVYARRWSTANNARWNPVLEVGEESHANHPNFISRHSCIINRKDLSVRLPPSGWREAVVALDVQILFVRLVEAVLHLIRVLVRNVKRIVEIRSVETEVIVRRNNSSSCNFNNSSVRVIRLRTRPAILVWPRPDLALLRIALVYAIPKPLQQQKAVHQKPVLLLPFPLLQTPQKLPVVEFTTRCLCIRTLITIITWIRKLKLTSCRFSNTFWSKLSYLVTDLAIHHLWQKTAEQVEPEPHSVQMTRKMSILTVRGFDCRLICTRTTTTTVMISRTMKVLSFIFVFLIHSTETLILIHLFFTSWQACLMLKTRHLSSTLTRASTWKKMTTTHSSLWRPFRLSVNNPNLLLLLLIISAPLLLTNNSNNSNIIANRRLLSNQSTPKRIQVSFRAALQPLAALTAVYPMALSLVVHRFIIHRGWHRRSDQDPKSLWFLSLVHSTPLSWIGQDLLDWKAFGQLLNRLHRCQRAPPFNVRRLR